MIGSAAVLRQGEPVEETDAALPYYAMVRPPARSSSPGGVDGVSGDGGRREIANSDVLMRTTICHRGSFAARQPAGHVCDRAGSQAARQTTRQPDKQPCIETASQESSYAGPLLHEGCRCSACNVNPEDAAGTWVSGWLVSRLSALTSLDWLVTWLGLLGWVD